ncbi:MAG: HsdM family class I SAM-dependent methyltransferase [Acidimicrobiales bacterium]
MPNRDAPELGAWLRSIRDLAAAGVDRAGIMLATAIALGDRLGRAFPERGIRLSARALPIVPPPSDDAGPDLLGRAYESTLDTDHRRAAGAHYTPAAVADRLVELALDDLPGRPTVCDPACGGGAFLLAAGRTLARRGVEPRHVVAELLWGVDVDPLAVAVTEAALYLWSGSSPGDHLAVADALTSGLGAWPRPPTRGFAAVVGNPPFQSQLGRRTARSPAAAETLRSRYRNAVAAYADTAWIFLAAAIDLTRPGGRVVLIQPQSLLAARDADGVRRLAVTCAALEGLWLPRDPIFDAAVWVCAPVLRVGESPLRTIRVWEGADVREREPIDFDPDASSWAPLAAEVQSVPHVRLATDDRTLGAIARATAGFRDEYYGLTAFVVDDPDHAADDRAFPRVVTSGLIEPGRVAWGERRVRLAKAHWEAPRLDLNALCDHGQARIARWVCDRLVPKVVVATQSRAVEAAIDADGTWVPSTPVISVEAPPEALAHIAAVLLAPPVTAWALRQAAGTALAPGVVKLAARQVVRIPLPLHRAPWDDAAGLVGRFPPGPRTDEHRRLLAHVGVRMCAAYGVEEVSAGLLEWWAARLP